MQKPSLKRLLSYSNKRTKLVLLCVLVTLLLVIGYSQLIAGTMDLQASEADTNYFDQELKPLRVRPPKLPKQIKAIDFRVGVKEVGGLYEGIKIYAINIGTELKLDRKFDFHKIDMKICHFKSDWLGIENEYSLDWLSCIKLKRTNPYCFIFFGPSLIHLKRSEGRDGYYASSFIGINSGLSFNSMVFGSFLLGGKVQCHYLPLGKSASFYEGEEFYPQRRQLFDLVMQMEAGVVVTKHAIVKITGEIRKAKGTYALNTIPVTYKWSNWREKELMLSVGLEFRF